MNKNMCKFRRIMRKEGYTLHPKGTAVPVQPNTRVFIIMEAEIPEVLVLGQALPYGSGIRWDWTIDTDARIVAWKEDTR